MNEEELPADNTNEIESNQVRSEDPAPYQTQRSEPSTPRSAVVMELFPEAQMHLNRIRQWTYFFGIIGYIGIGFLLIVGVGLFALWSSMPELNETLPSWIGLIYVVLAGAYIYPVVKLMEFSSKMKTALGKAEGMDLNAAFQALRQHFGYLGWFTVAFLILYVLILLIVMVTGAAAAM